MNIYERTRNTIEALLESAQPGNFNNAVIATVIARKLAEDGLLIMDPVEDES